MSRAARTFRKKPVVVEAMQFDGTPESCAAVAAWVAEHGGAAIQVAPYPSPCLHIKTPEGMMVASASPGDWIVRGAQGEFYRCKLDIFAETYEPVTADDESRRRPNERLPGEEPLPIRLGGLMPCCVATYEAIAPPAADTREGDLLSCSYCIEQMHVRDGAWEWARLSRDGTVRFGGDGTRSYNPNYYGRGHLDAEQARRWVTKVLERWRTVRERKRQGAS